MLLVSPRNSAPGTRYRMHLRLPPSPGLPGPATRLRCGFPHSGGRNRAGRRTVWTKGGRAQRRVFTHACEQAEGSRLLGLVCGVFWQTHTRAALALVKNAAGAWFFSPAPAGLEPLGYFGAVATHTLSRAARGEHPEWWWPLRLLPPYTRAGLFPLRGGGRPRLVRSPGSTALVLTARLWDDWALLVLPSGQLAVSPNSPFVILGGLTPGIRAGVAAAKAGVNHRLGRAPRVRGVAMNPNDHPHGGRTKAVKYPRTPWGRTTRFPRPARPKLKLKALSKRRPRAL